ncbi:MAG: hypothetical protein K1X68_13245 [Saprospiraceae bacterium]|nr:hypothetical protein [Saprospiraceae bacterium]HMW40117.1 hypothetical protein [Saprospiraceae bacterium]HMX88271.1 hypothetical protein [Saprospiraceae bacterium]HMZ40445.1 hypothetical protein [Saprospiraceae bacterium]HNA64089.1 hypothetical protein [Saprospiraceae bacterium]
MNKICFILIFLSLFELSIYGQQATATKEGVTLTLKSKTTLGKGAMIYTYCQDKSQSKNCSELIVSKDGQTCWMPMTSGPVYNILKTGKTANYKGMNQYEVKGAKTKQYYVVNGNNIIVVTPLNLSHVVSVIKMGDRPLKDAEVKSIFKDNDYDPIKDECKCNSKYWACLIGGLKSWDNLDDLAFWKNYVCDKNLEECTEICKNIEMKLASSILVKRKTIAASDFQIAIKDR